MGVWWATGSALASTMSLIGTTTMSGKCWCSHVLNVLDMKKFKSHVCKCCWLASVARNGSWVGFSGGVWQRRQLQAELRALSVVGGMADGVVHRDPSASSSSAVALLRCSVSPTVGKFCTGLSTQEQLVSITGYINNLAGFEDLLVWGSACQSQDDGTKYLYSIVVCSMHVHYYRDQVIFT